MPAAVALPCRSGLLCEAAATQLQQQGQRPKRLLEASRRGGCRRLSREAPAAARPCQPRGWAWTQPQVRATTGLPVVPDWESFPPSGMLRTFAMRSQGGHTGGGKLGQT